MQTKLIRSDFTPLGPTDPFALFTETELVPDKAFKLGTLDLSDQGFTVNCSYAQLLALTEAKARAVGANLTKIINHKYPDTWSTCHRLVAEMYWLKDVRPYETAITWLEGRRLEWEDFKGGTSFTEDRLYAARTHSSIAVWAGEKRGSGVNVKAIFHTKTSWVDTATLSPEVLVHEQIHFDLTELYARKMRQAFGAAGSNATVMIDFIFNKYGRELDAAQEGFDRETLHGANKDAQEEWIWTIRQGLEELRVYQ